MYWVFIVFGIATLIYASLIIKEYSLEARIQRGLEETLVAEKLRLEEKIQEQKVEENEIKVQIEEVKKNVKEYEDIVHKHDVEIKKFEAELAKRGKYRV